MRLLNTSTLRGESVLYDNIPQYAILSHTWGSDEVTFQQLQELNSGERSGELNSTHPVRQGGGFAKIPDSGNLACISGYEFIWITLAVSTRLRVLSSLRRLIVCFDITRKQLSATPAFPMSPEQIIDKELVKGPILGPLRR
jgi:hypothetical protein